MNMLWHELADAYKEAIYDRADQRTAGWLLVESPVYPIAIACCYAYMSFNARSLTAKMPTYNLKSFIIAYNATMVALSVYMTYEFFMTAYVAGYSVTCQPVVYDNSPNSLRMAKVCWLYYFSKYIELMETAVFALRKKYNQISFLHSYHHTSMIGIWWLTTKYLPGGQGYIFGGINSFVHAVMYTYYGLSAGGPKMQKYLWWKKYITMLQLSQFVILFFYCIRSIAVDCKYAKWMCSMMIGYAISLLVLFLNFYIKAYLNRGSKAKSAASNGVRKQINGGMANGYSHHQNGSVANGIKKQE
ncbi:unnamed protein product [Clavelina lepadiformis]|uniref:Elongation of very long chain fatty acids protein n=1 Tax=Clavelina lepadiformis TaxID=159417 RepID=A0ABP0F973_CLALP